MTNESSSAEQTSFDKFQEGILVFSLCLFSAISIYTTKIGLGLVWSDTSGFERILLTWGMALAIGSFLLYLTLQVARSASDLPILQVVIAYTMVGFISVFFNFNAVYSAMASKDIEIENNHDIATRTDDLYAGLLSFLKEDIDSKRQEVNVLLSRVQTEEDHAIRPGRGPLYQRNIEEYSEAKAVLDVEEETYKENIDSIREIMRSLSEETITDAAEYEEIRANTQAAVQRLMKLQSRARSLGFEPPENQKDMLDFLADKKSLNFSLVTLFDEVKKIFSGHRSQQNLGLVLLSTAIALLIDLPVFFSLVVLRAGKIDRTGRSQVWAERRKYRRYTERSLWE